MRKRLWKPSEVLIQIMEPGRDMSLKEIYAKAKEKLPQEPKLLEKTYGQPNFQHSIRKTLLYLIKKREVVRIGKGVYRKA